MARSRIAQGVVGTAFAALLGAGAAAQPARPPAPPAPAQGPAPAVGTAQISGVIKNASDDSPIARARVSAAADVLPQPRVTLSGADGKYSLTDLTAGSYTISVARTGYARQAYSQGHSITSTPMALASGQPMRNVDFALVPGGFIVGRIFDEDGSPFAGAIVDALVTRSDNGTDTLFSVSSSQTDDRGEFRLFGLAPGHYYVSAADPAFRAVSTPKGVLYYSPTYFPGVPFADQARPVVVTGAGDPPKVELQLTLVPPARVAGQLQASDGRPLFSAAIIMSPVEGAGAPIVSPEDPKLMSDRHSPLPHVFPR